MTKDKNSRCVLSLVCMTLLAASLGCDGAVSAKRGDTASETRYIAVDEDDVDREYRVRFNEGDDKRPSVLVMGSAERSIQWYQMLMSRSKEKRAIDFFDQIKGGNSYAEMNVLGESRQCYVFSAEHWTCKINSETGRVFLLFADEDTLYACTTVTCSKERKYVRE